MPVVQVCHSIQIRFVVIPLTNILHIAPPSAPRSLNLVTSTNVSCTISWEAPSDDGGRNDTFYSITQVHIEKGNISGIFAPTTTVNTHYVIKNLKPVTTYQIRITAENGVSAYEMCPEELHRRTATVTCTTKEGGR